MVIETSSLLLIKKPIVSILIMVSIIGILYNSNSFNYAIAISNIQHNGNLLLTDTHFLLPFGSNNGFVNNFNNPDTTVVNSISCDSNNLVDNFVSPYYLTDGQISPNGKWQNGYSGYGSTGVENSLFFLKPQVSTMPSETHAALVKSTGSFCNFDLNFNINTLQQLRQNNLPNTWEVGWMIFRFTDDFHYYWFVIKTNGIELGKKDCDTCTDPVDGQQFLVTEDNPKLILNSWSNWHISAIGNHIQIFADGKLLIDYVDKSMSPKLSKGNIGMYSEDAFVKYSNMHLTPK